jgi:hypothetical protein
MANGCSDAVQTSVAEAYRSLALAIFGCGARDKMQLAEMSVSASIADIGEAEAKSKRELTALIKRVRELDPVRQRAHVQELLGRTRVLRASLAGMAKKRAGMEQNLETLRQSQLNQNMLLSMKHTTDALQTLGLKVSDADTIMLDLEESTGDIAMMQNVLGSTYSDTELSQEDLDAELALILSDDAMCPTAVPRRKQQPQPDSQTTNEVQTPIEQQAHVSKQEQEHESSQAVLPDTAVEEPRPDVAESAHIDTTEQTAT